MSPSTDGRRNGMGPLLLVSAFQSPSINPTTITLQRRRHAGTAATTPTRKTSQCMSPRKSEVDFGRRISPFDYNSRQTSLTYPTTRLYMCLLSTNNAAISSSSTTIPTEETTVSSSSSSERSFSSTSSTETTQKPDSSASASSLSRNDDDDPFVGVSRCERIFDLNLPQGRCVGVRLLEDDVNNDKAKDDLSLLTKDAITQQGESHWIYTLLHPREIEYGLSLKSDIVRRSFLLGRLALRDSLDLLQRPTSGSSDDDRFGAAILKDQYGRPQVPVGSLGSISHKGSIAVALVARNSSTQSITTKKDHEASEVNGKPVLGIGVDIEGVAKKTSSAEDGGGDGLGIARKVLTKNEIDQLGNIQGVSKEDEVLLRFSLKESLYKAMHPLICQYVGFQEAEIKPLSDGRAIAKLMLKSDAHLAFDTVSLHWQRISVPTKARNEADTDDFFLTSASVRVKEFPKDTDDLRC